ncbi:MAG: four helix bundle protein [Pseudomonadota bacterium]
MEKKSKPIQDYRDLTVWREGMTLAELVYAMTADFPSTELYGLTSQMRRSAVSIPSNIAEGFGRAQRKPFIQFLRVAQGSLKELETQIELSSRLGFIKPEISAGAMEATRRLGKRLVVYIRSLEASA